MKIYIYSGGEKIVGRSGVGQAIRHQRECEPDKFRLRDAPGQLQKLGKALPGDHVAHGDHDLFLACGVPTVLRDIPVYDGWLEHRETVYKSSNDGEFQRIVSGLLDKTLPDLTAAGRAAAESRSLEQVGRRLKAIYLEQRVLPPLPAALPQTLAFPADARSLNSPRRRASSGTRTTGRR